nr:hypothetical protein BaRGS_016852 [Batillaria attramentaria]
MSSPAARKNRWSSTDYGGVEEVLLKQKSVWVPDIVPANTVSTHTELGYDNLRVRVSNKGVVLWEPSVLLTTSCSIDITYYPLDTQICTIAFHTSVSVQSEVHVYLDKTDPIVMTHFSENGLWNLLNYSTADFVEMYQSPRDYQLQLQRRREFYILNIVLPILFLSVTSSLTFALPADAGEKMGLSITILLAYAVYLTLVTEAMPSTSSTVSYRIVSCRVVSYRIVSYRIVSYRIVCGLQVSYLAIYLIILLAMTALSVVLSVWILSYHHRSEKRPVHGWLAKVTLTLGKALRMPKDDSEAPYDVDSPDLGHLKMKKNSIGPCDVLADAPSILNAIEMKPQGRSHGNEETKLPTVQRKPVEVSGRLVAQTFDRLIFILFFTISLGSTAILMLILWFGSIQQEENTRM